MTRPGGERPLLLTTPIYYVNDKPHIGHAYTTLLADVLARFHRSRGREVFFLTGTDEHGAKVAETAAKRGVAPQAHCDEMVLRFRGLWKRLGIVPDAFVRTTDAAHKEFVRAYLGALEARGEVEARDFEGWYCVGCERFWTQKDLAEGNLCPDCRRPVQRLAEKNYFFLMSKYREKIRAAVEGGVLEILPPSRRNEVLGFLDKPLEDLCISRPKSRLAWGIEIPFAPDYVTYVWFDALLNYISAPGEERWARSERVHLIGKDILTTHSVYWPAMLFAGDRSLPDRIVAHGWWRMTGEKMSKSVGNVVDPNAILDEWGDEIGGDLLRYFLLREVPLGEDGNFAFEALEERYRADLANDLGNLLGRLSAPKLLAGAQAARPIPHASLAPAVEAARAAFEAYRPHEAIEKIFAFLRELNRQLQAAKPWEGGPEAGQVVRSASLGLFAAAGLLAPVLPYGAAKIAERFGKGRPPSWSEVEAFLAHAFLAHGEEAGPFEGVTAPASGASLYPKREAKPAEAAPAMEKKMPAPASGPPAEITYDDFAKLDLRVARVEKAEVVAGKDRLLRLEISLGQECRTLVAGIAKSYAPENLVGRSIVIVANLKPAKIGGVLSQGMLLCASEGEGLALVAPEREIPSGARVK